MYDIAIIGAGVVGSLIARELAKYNLSLIVLEKENDVSMGSSKANSGIVHAGYDTKTGTLKALLNVKGCKMMPRIAEELGVEYRQNGSLVTAFQHEEMEAIKDLYTRGRLNGVEDLTIVDQQQLRIMEPYLNPAAIGALYAPTAGIICPYTLTVAALGNAMDNGVVLKCNFPVTALRDKSSYFEIVSNREVIEAAIVINVAGLFADEIAAMVGDDFFSLHPRRGEYYLFDREMGHVARQTVFQMPTALGKGVLVTPTAHGNLMIGPNAEDIDNKQDKMTTKAGLNKVWKDALKSMPCLPKNGVITEFTGLRASGNTGDFIITQSPAHSRLLHVAGIDSPGLASSPAIAAYVEDMLRQMGVLTQKRSNFNPYRRPIPALREMKKKERLALIASNPAYGRIVCRCEEISEGEVLDAIRQNPKATDIDGIKRRTRTGMGRCQGGFCMPTVAEILSRELGIPMEQITKKGPGSEILTGKTK
jgi:glycerol-3-phosphate dehydrogenase